MFMSAAIHATLEAAGNGGVAGEQSRLLDLLSRLEGLVKTWADGTKTDLLKLLATGAIPNGCRTRHGSTLHRRTRRRDGEVWTVCKEER